MKILYSFILKDLKEFVASKKIILFMLVSVCYPMILNIINAISTTKPLIPLEMFIIPASIFSACFAGELLYFFTINELKQKIFDIFLVSKVKIMQLILCKTIVPILIASICAILSIVANNFLVELSANYDLIPSKVSFINIFIVILGAVISSLIELIVLLISKNKTNNSSLHTFTLFISFVFIVILYTLNFLFGLIVFSISIIGTLGVLLGVTYYLINYFSKKTYYKKKRKVFSLFKSNEYSCSSALLRKEIVVSEFGVLKIVKLLLLIIFSSYISCLYIENIKVLQLIFRIIFYFVCSLGAFDILLPVMIVEKINKQNEIINIAKVTKTKIYFIKNINSYLLTIVGLILSSILIEYFGIVDSKVLIDLGTIAIVFLTTTTTNALCYKAVSYINSYKDIRLTTVFTMTLAFIIHVIFCYVFYLVY